MNPRKSSLFDLRAGAVDALHLSLKTADMAALQRDLQQRLDAAPDFLRDEAIVLDLRRMEAQAHPDLDTLAQWLRERGLHPLGVIGQPGEPRPSGSLPLLHSQGRAGEPGVAPEPEAPPAAPPEPTPSPAPGTVVVDRPLRSGQRIYAPGDLIVLDAVSHGAEIIAGGHIHVYAPLRGRALAGAHGDTSARIFCSTFEPELVAIAGVYRTAEQALPPELAGQSVQVRLDGDRLHIQALPRR